MIRFMRLVALACSVLALPHAFGAPPAELGPACSRAVQAAGVPGGLLVVVGAAAASFEGAFGRSGRFLVHVLDPDAGAVDSARQRVAASGLEAVVSADRLRGGKLPYTENLVNALIVTASAAPDAVVTATEMHRVVCPRGVVLAAPSTVSSDDLAAAGFEAAPELAPAAGWITARKPWPVEMDEWTHPRHSAAGNAASRDTVVGPPRRVRWVAGPWEETANLISADGRNFYGGLLARDGFNGLRIWTRNLTPSTARGGFGYRGAAGAPPPVAGGGRVFVLTDGKVCALDTGTGRIVREYPQAGEPRQLLFADGVLIAVDGATVRAVEARSGRSLWTHDASEPRLVVAGDDVVALVQGNSRRGEKSVVVALDRLSGRVRWQREDTPWAAKASRCVYYHGQLAFEVSSLNDNAGGNAVHVLSTADGSTRFERGLFPGMSHFRQARAMFIGDRLWMLRGGRGEGKERHPTKVDAIDYLTGEVKQTWDAGLAHCFPPVATPRFLFSGEMDLIDLASGTTDANRITKGACGRDVGWMPANGLIAVTPKHCVCWPMLRGFAALAGARPGGNPARAKVDEIEFSIETDVAAPDVAASDRDDDWPCYRHDAWRSGSTTSDGPETFATRWATPVDSGSTVSGPIVDDQRDDPYVKGPITAPVVAEGIVCVARPDAHEVVALDAASGAPRWRFKANARVDTPPTLYRGLCLFGAKSGEVYCLRAADGALVWRLRVAPIDERIVAYGQLESPWPVPGSVLVVDDTVYFAAGRQSLAARGLVVCAVDPRSGERRWVTRLDSVPQDNFYASNGLEFDNFDLLHLEDEGIGMSRWVFDRKTGDMSVALWDVFARVDTGGGAAMVPPGCWTYAPRNQKRAATFEPLRPLVVFRDNVLYGSSEDKSSLYRRDFRLDDGEKFDKKWKTGWAGSKAARDGKEAWRSQRLAKGAKWNVGVFDSKQDIVALALARNRVYAVGSQGALRAIDKTTGAVVARAQLPIPARDGLAIAAGQLVLSTLDGRVVCVGAR